MRLSFLRIHKTLLCFCSWLLLFLPSASCFVASSRTGQQQQQRQPTTTTAPKKNADDDAAPPLLGTPICEYHQITVPTTQKGPPRQAISVEDLTPTLETLLRDSGMVCGTVTVLSRHTTTAITINERESRLARDTASFLLQLAPPDERSEAAPVAVPGVRYEHNDIDQRPESDEEAARCRQNGWDIDDPQQLEKWRAQEPINAHSHLISMLLGSSESIPVVDAALTIGQWQSVLLVDLDGPRDRTVGVQLMGYRQSVASTTTTTETQ